LNYVLKLRILLFHIVMRNGERILFVTGAGTGEGKTVLTAMLLAFLRRGGADALAAKPFCSGSRADARLLQSLQKECLTLDEVNPFYFDKPLAPAAAGPGRPKVPLEAALGQIRLLAGRCDLLAVEGAGGLLAPLGRDYTARDLIRRLRCQTLVVGRNRLGVINHVLLTAEALQSAGIRDFTVVLMGVRKPDLSAGSNPRMIRQRLPATPVFCLPYLGFGASKAGEVKKNAKYFKKTLAQLLRHDILHVFFRNRKRLDDGTC
jgi:dethiobiotin synthetase